MTGTQARMTRISTMVAASLVMFLLGAIYAYGVLLPALMQDFGWPRATAALPQAILLFVYAVAMAIGGTVQDRTSPTAGVILGGLLFGGGLLFAGTAHDLLALVWRYGLLSGVGFGFAYVASVTAVMRAFPGRRGLAAGVVVGAFGLGAFVWAPWAQRVLPVIGWSGTLSIFGALCFVLIPVLGLGIRAAHSPAMSSQQATGLTLGQALRVPIFWLIFAAYALVTSVGLLLLAHLVNFGLDRGLQAKQAAWLLSASALGSSSGRVIMGWLSDRWGRLPCLIGACAVETVLLLALVWASTPLVIFLIAGGTGFAFGTWLALYGPIATDLFGLRAAGAIYGALYLSYGLGGLIGPTLGGALADATGGYEVTFLIAAALAIIGMALFWLAARRHPPHYAHPPASEEEFPENA